MNWEDAVYVSPTSAGSFGGYTADLGARQLKSGFSSEANPYRASPSSSNWLSTLSKSSTGYTPPAFPQSLNVVEPWSSRSAKPVASVDTTGDWGASLGASLNNAIGQGGYLNLGNAIPWMQERSFVAAKELANTVGGGDTSFVGGAIDAFSNVVKAVAEPVAKVLDFFPNTVRDSTLNSRMEIYKALVTGQHVNPLMTLGSQLPVPGANAYQNQISGVNYIADLLAGSRATPDQIAAVKAVVAGMIDLPESVKSQIEQDPNGDLAGYLDKAPEGRNFTYVGGIEGGVTNFASMGLLYGIEMMASGGLSAVARAGSLAAEAPALWQGAEVATKAAGLGVRALQAASASKVGALAFQGASVFGKVTKVALATGITMFPATILVDTALRTMGDKQGVAYLDHINRTALISDSPAVQLVSSFTVDPIGAAKAAVKGELRFLGTAPVLVDKALGRRFSTLYTHETALIDRLALMYGIDRKTAGELIGPGLTYESKGVAFDNVIGLAVDSLVQKLPEEAKSVINSLPRDQRTPAIFKMYTKQVLAEVDNPSGLVARFRRDWMHHDFYGEFDPEIAKIVTRDFHEAEVKTVDARMRTDSVVGRVDLLNPEGQALVQGRIEATFADGRQGTLRDLNMLSAKHPALDGLVKDLVTKGVKGKPFVKPGDLVPREVFDEALTRAKAEYAALALKNPVRVATGTDPVLRPGVHLSDWAAAFATDEATIRAVTTDPTAATTSTVRDLIARFVRDKKLMSDTEIATATPDEIWLKANDHLNTAAEPWVARGTQVADIESLIGKASDHATALRNLGIGGQELDDAEGELSRLRALEGDVRDPVAAAASGAIAAQRAGGSTAVKRALYAIDAQTRLETISAIVDELRPAQTLAFGDLLHSVKLAQGEWVWSASTRVVGGPVYDAAIGAFQHFRYSGGFAVRATRKYAARVKGRTQAEIGFIESPTMHQAAEMADPKSGFLEYLRSKDPAAPLSPTDTVTFGEAAELVAKNQVGRVTTEITPGMVEALGVTTPEGFIARVGALRAAYDEALGGKTLYNLGRAAKVKVDDWAAALAKKGEQFRLLNDPEAEVAYNTALNKLKGALDGEFPGVRAIVEGDPLLRAQARELAAQNGVGTAAGGVHGWGLGSFLSNPENREALRTLISNKLEPPVIPGVPRDATALGQRILAGDTTALPEIKDALAKVWGSVAKPLKDVPAESVDGVAFAPRLSSVLTDDLNAQGIHWQTLIPEVLWAKSEAGAKALAVLTNMNLHQPPRTIQGLLSALKEIENGHANAFMGPELQAEAQRLGREVVGSMVGDARRAGLELGVVGMGKMLNPKTWSADTEKMLQELFAQTRSAGGKLVFRDELGLQYGLKARPTGKISPATGVREGQAVAVDMSSVPGLAEELFQGHFQPWNERVQWARTQQTFSRLFNIGNQQITFEARGRFETALAKVGIPAAAAEKVWTAWRDAAKASRETKFVKIKTGEHAGEYYSKLSDNARYATEKNIPNNELDRIARETLDTYYERAGGIPDAVARMKFSDEMRIAGSFTRRQLQKAPLGDALEQLYGKFAHNEWVTTKYYLFRFQLDTRFHAMNRFESPSLYTGRAGLKTGEIDQGMFGMTKDEVLREQSMEPMLSTGYPFNASRGEWLYRTMLKEQPDALRGMVKADPKLFERALGELASIDPELSVTIRDMGHTPNDYLRVMNEYWGKVMRSADPESVVTQQLAKELVNSPELVEVFGRIEQVNHELLGSLRDTFYGNPERGQVERVLNSYLLYWPLSYQIKATKWLLHIMYGKIGGVQTGGLGAYALDQMQADHQRLLATDPDYAKWFDEHQSLVFAAQMMLPIAPGSIGVGMNPLIRDTFFGGTKNILEVGPIYTFTKFLPHLYGDLYPTVEDLLGSGIADIPSRVLGQNPPKAKSAPTPWTPVTP